MTLEDNTPGTDIQPPDVLDFWFDGPASRMRDVWFKRSDPFDAAIRARFSDAYHGAAAGACDHWMADGPGALALVILLDQVPRNLFRDDARAYATDAKALAHARAAIDAGFDRDLNWVERMFLYMPYQHAEDLAVQDRSVELFSQLPNAESLKAAEGHRAVIRRFGRFPHRNRDLGRDTTSEEAQFLEESGRGF